MDDKIKELLRYDERAHAQLVDHDFLNTKQLWGSAGIPLIYRSPYIYYEKCIHKFVVNKHNVLEIGSGTGIHTHGLLQTGAKVTATDISYNSILLLKKQLSEMNAVRLKVVVADMETLPFKDESFDIVSCAGSLSYGEPDRVDYEIHRILRPGGIFICIDSLNHNPLYKLNRWIQYLRHSRTKKTLLCMPNLYRINSIAEQFRRTDVRYFGAFLWMMPILSKVMGENNASNISDKLDGFFHIRKSAFKFVLVARK